LPENSKNIIEEKMTFEVEKIPELGELRGYRTIINGKVMSFIVRNLTKEECKKYNIALSDGRCAVDEERDAVLLNRGGGGRENSPDYLCELIWRGDIVKFKSPKFAMKNQDGKRLVHWPIRNLSIPPELEGQESKVKQLIKEAIIIYGESGGNHLPIMRYDILIISGLEESPFQYIAGE
jgi:hypothetical protein